MLSPALILWLSKYGYAGLFSLLMVGILGLPVPDETLLTFAGYLVFQKQLHFLPTGLAAFLGSVCGITLSYTLGRTVGLKLVAKFGARIHLTPAKLDEVQRWFDRLGKWTLTIGYFLPGLRHFTAIVAGMSRLRMPVFGLFAYAGALIWSTTFITLGYFFGEAWSRMSARLHQVTAGASLVVVAAMLVFFLWRFYARRSRPCR